MLDRLVHSTLNAAIMGMIALLAAATLICAHWGVLGLLSGTVPPAIRLLLAALLLAGVLTFMILHRNDLADR